MQDLKMLKKKKLIEKNLQLDSQMIYYINYLNRDLMKMSAEIEDMF